LLAENEVPLAAERLIADLTKRGVRLSTGFVGTRDLMFALVKIGRTDLAYRLLLNRDFPSWGFTIENGATSIWERWNGWTPDQGFNDPGMNSFAHYAFGAVGEWLFRVVGGIEALDAGFSRIRIQPRLGGELTWARTSYNSIRGPIASVWRLDRGTIHLLVTIPPNCTAEVHIPTNDWSSVMEGGTNVENAQDVRVLRHESGALVVEVGSGRYAFSATAPR
jgi:alpha-L-rhamnosidase